MAPLDEGNPALGDQPTNVSVVDAETLGYGRQVHERLDGSGDGHDASSVIAVVRTRPLKAADLAEEDQMSVCSSSRRATMVSMAATPTVPNDLVVDQEQLVDICERYGVVELSVFGSVARGEARDDSDLDLLYVLGPGQHLGFAINQLEDELSALFERRVDLVSKKALHRAIRDDVLAEARKLHAA